ncbi:hypothetical protein [Burkholderia sp. PU8-34]
MVDEYPEQAFGGAQAGTRAGWGRVSDPEAFALLDEITASELIRDLGGMRGERGAQFRRAGVRVVSQRSVDSATLFRQSASLAEWSATGLLSYRRAGAANKITPQANQHYPNATTADFSAGHAV